MVSEEQVAHCMNATWLSVLFRVSTHIMVGFVAEVFTPPQPDGLCKSLGCDTKLCK